MDGEKDSGNIDSRDTEIRELKRKLRVREQMCKNHTVKYRKYKQMLHDTKEEHARLDQEKIAIFRAQKAYYIGTGRALMKDELGISLYG